MPKFDSNPEIKNNLVTALEIKKETSYSENPSTDTESFNARNTENSSANYIWKSQYQILNLYHLIKQKQRISQYNSEIFSQRK